MDRTPATPLARAAAQPLPVQKQHVSEGYDPDAAPFTALVAKDGLYFRVVIGSCRSGSSKEVAAVQSAFRRAFVNVWRHIPVRDQGVLLLYWGHPPGWLHRHLLPSHPRPLIQVVENESPAPSPPIRLWGHELTFSPTRVVEPPHRLPSEIARILAEVYCLAIGLHGKLVLELLEGPYTACERRQGARVSGAARQKKWETLENAFLRRHEAEVARVMDQWALRSYGLKEGSEDVRPRRQ